MMQQILQSLRARHFRSFLTFTQFNNNTHCSSFLLFISIYFLEHFALLHNWLILAVNTTVASAQLWNVPALLAIWPLVFTDPKGSSSTKFWIPLDCSNNSIMSINSSH